MSYVLIKGFFHVVGQSPDGDSIKFSAENPTLWEKIETDHRAIFEKNLAETDMKTGVSGVVNLRFQGIDALETHYTPSTPPPPSGINPIGGTALKKPIASRYAQPHVLGKAATSCLLALIGVKQARWHRFGFIDQISVKDGRKLKELGMEAEFKEDLPGHIIVRDVERRGRPIAWVFAGTTRTRDGSQISKMQLRSRLARSLNYQLLEKGLVYPYFYMTLPSLFRKELIDATSKAIKEANGLANNARLRNAALRESRRAAKMQGLPLPEKLPNVWIYDQTLRGLKVRRLDDLVDKSEMWPYLFRKLLSAWHRDNTERYWQAVELGRQNEEIDWQLIDLDVFFQAGDAYVFTVSDRDFVRLSDVVEVTRGRLKMKIPPHEIVFLS
ncbi:MAG: hypothetical protein AAF633_21230 [Chloroflexota bacterium]